MKKIVSLLMALWGLQNAVAGGESVVDVQLGNGVQSLNYSPVSEWLVDNGSVALGEAKKMWGCNLGGMFNRYYNMGFGFQAGLRFYLYRSNCLLDSTEQFEVNDMANSLSCVRSVSYDGWKEQQTNCMIAIPIGASYKRPLTDKLDLYVGMGVEFLMPVSSRYKVKKGQVETSGYYEAYDVDFTDMPVHNFSTIEDRPSGKNTLKIGLAGYVDAGLRYRMGKIYGTLGAYLSCGLTDMSDGSSSPLFNLNDVYSGVLNSRTIDGTRPMAFGLKLGVGLPVGRTNTSK